MTMLRRCLFVAVVFFLFGAPARAQQYYIDDGESIRPVYSGQPGDVQPEYWTIRLYRKGQSTGGRDNWGSITGKTAAEVMDELREGQRIEEEDERVNGPSRSGLTDFNYTGPIAVMRKEKTNQQQLADALERIWEARHTLKTLWDGTRKESNPFRDVGRVSSEYTDNLRDARKRLRQVEKDLDHLNPKIDEIDRGLDDFQQTLDSLSKEHRAFGSAGTVSFGTPGTGWLMTKPNGRKEWIFFNTDGTAKTARLGESGWYDASAGSVYQWRREGDALILWKEGSAGKWQLSVRGNRVEGKLFGSGAADSSTVAPMNESPLKH